MNAESTPKCPQCGAPLPPDAPDGLCPQCVMALNLKTETLFSAEPTPAQAPLTPEQIAPHFPQLEILEYLGRGGMGVVYKARQKTLNRLVALKLLAPERVHDPEFAARFTREAQALAAMNHPNIVTIHDFGRADLPVGRGQESTQQQFPTEAIYYFVMEFVDGVNLRHLLRARKFTPEEALAIVPPLCDALQYAHERGIVHRDIKPENILLDKAGRVKVADFGIAKIVGNVAQTSSSAGSGDFPVASSTNAGQESPANPQAGKPALQDLTEAHKVFGTPGYSAPEQKADPQRVDSRADIYSLGVVFYEMLTGELPGKRIEPPSKKVHIDVRLDEIVLRALESKPELRYQQASILKTQVETIAETPPTPGAERVPKPAGTDFRSKQTIFGLPWVHLAWGRDPATNKPRVATGFIAIGPEARGVIPVGFIAFGVFPIGLLAAGLLPVGLMAIGLFPVGLAAAGLRATGLFAFAIQSAVGLVAVAPKPVALAKWAVDKGTVFRGWIFVVLIAAIMKWLILRALESKPELRNKEPGSTATGKPTFPITTFIGVGWVVAGLVLVLIGNYTTVQSNWWGYWLLGLCILPSAAYLLEKSFKDKARPLVTKQPQTERPWQLIAVAVISILSGFPSLWSIGKSIAQGAFPAGGDTGLLSLLVGVGLLRLRPWWRKTAIVLLLLSMTIMIVAGLFAVSGVKLPFPHGAVIFGYWIKNEFLGSLVNLGMLILAVWQYLVLIRPDVKALFNKRGFNRPLFEWAVLLVAVAASAGLATTIEPRKDNSLSKIRNVKANAGQVDRPVIKPPFTARLTNGQVELVAIGDMPWTNTVCWVPNGDALSANPFSSQDFTLGGWAANQVMRKVAFRIHNQSPEGMSYPVCQIDRQSGVLAQGSGLQPHDRRSPDDEFFQIIACPTNADTMDISLGLANAAWETAISLPNSGLSGTYEFKSVSEGDWSATYNAIRGKGTEMAVSCSYTKNEDWESRMVYVTDNDQTISIRENSSRSGTNQTGATLLISTNEFAHIKEFQLQRRKYQWVEFRNVSLKGGVKTIIDIRDFGGPYAIRPAQEQLPFGPVIERILSDAQSADQPGFLDLQTGQTFSRAEVFPGNPLTDRIPLALTKPGAARALETRDITLGGHLNGSIPCLFVWNATTHGIGEAGWNTVDEPNAEYPGWDNKSLRDILNQLPPPPSNSCSIISGEPPQVFLVKTRRGVQAIVQITGFTENPRGVKIRYKLVQSRGTATRSYTIERGDTAVGIARKFGMSVADVRTLNSNINWTRLRIGQEVRVFGEEPVGLQATNTTNGASNSARHEFEFRWMAAKDGTHSPASDLAADSNQNNRLLQMSLWAIRTPTNLDIEQLAGPASLAAIEHSHGTQVAQQLIRENNEVILPLIATTDSGLETNLLFVTARLSGGEVKFWLGSEKEKRSGLSLEETTPLWAKLGFFHVLEKKDSEGGSHQFFAILFQPAESLPTSNPNTVSDVPALPDISQSNAAKANNPLAERLKTNAVAFQAEGIIRRQHSGATPEPFCTFSAAINAPKSLIHLKYFNGESFVCGTDGRDSFLLNEMTPERTKSPNATQFASISKGPYPSARAMAPIQLLWLAFGSSAAFDTNSATWSLEGFPEDRRVTNTVTLFPEYPRLPQYIQWFAGDAEAKASQTHYLVEYPKGFLCGEFTAESLTNFAGTHIPTGWRCTWKSPRNFDAADAQALGAARASRGIAREPDDVATGDTLLCEITNISPLNYRGDFRPELGTNVQISDYRFDTNGHQLPRKMIVVPDPRFTGWPSSESHAAQDEFQFRFVAAEGDTNSAADMLPFANRPNGKLRVLRDVILSSQDVQSAGFSEYKADQKSLQVFLTPSGREKFSKATERNIGRQLAIVWRGKVITAPAIRSRISDARVQITGNFSDAEAQQLLDLLNHRNPESPATNSSPGGTNSATTNTNEIYSSFDRPSAIGYKTISLSDMPSDTVLKIYQEISGRTVLHGSTLPLAHISLRTAALDRVSLLRLLDTALAENGIAMVLSGESAVKAVSVKSAVAENPPEIDLPWEQLPDSSSVMSRTVRLKNLKAAEVIPVLQPFATLPNSIVAIQDQNVLILRDYSAAIRRQLRLLQLLDTNESGSAHAPFIGEPGFYSSFDQVGQNDRIDSDVQFNNAPLDVVLKVYQEIAGRTVIYGALPAVTIDLKVANRVSRSEVLRLFDTVLAEHGTAMLYSEDHSIKAVPVAAIANQSLPEIDLPWEQLPDSSSPMMRIVRLKNVKAVEVVAVLAPFSKLPRSILPIQSQNLLILRDYSSAVRQQLKLLETLEQKMDSSTERLR